MPKKSIVILGTLDTKGEEIKYIKDLIEKRNYKTIVIDVGILGKPPFQPDVVRDEIAEAAGFTISEIASWGEEGKAIEAMIRGVIKIVKDLYKNGEIEGIISLGGSIGTSLGLEVMKCLPLEIPKLIVSTIAFTPLITSDTVSVDQAMMQTVADLWGLNRITKIILERAAGAIVGMVKAQSKRKPSEKPLVAITTLGSSAVKYASTAKRLLESKGYEVVVFHTVGIGGEAFEQLAEQGLITGALDLSAFELINYVCGGALPARKNRYLASGMAGIPRVIAPAAINWFQWAGSLEKLPQKYKSRKIRKHNPITFQVQVSREEMIKVAELMAERLNASRGPTIVLIPLRGFSSLDKPGEVFYDPKGREAFIKTLKEKINVTDILRIIELDVHIDDPSFAEKAVALLHAMITKEVGRRDFATSKRF